MVAVPHRPTIAGVAALALLAAATAPVHALRAGGRATVTCRGQVATIVGTAPATASARRDRT